MLEDVRRLSLTNGVPAVVHEKTGEVAFDRLDEEAKHPPPQGITKEEAQTIRQNEQKSLVVSRGIHAVAKEVVHHARASDGKRTKEEKAGKKDTTKGEPAAEHEPPNALEKPEQTVALVDQVYVAAFYEVLRQVRLDVLDACSALTLDSVFIGIRSLRRSWPCAIAYLERTRGFV